MSARIKIGSLVGGKSARKSDGQRVRTQNFAETLQGLRRFSAPFGLLHGAQAGKFNQPRFQAEMRFPKLRIVDAFNAFPDLRLAAVLGPAGAEVPVIETEHLRREPRRNMHAIRNMADRNSLFRPSRIQRRPHRARHFPVQRGNSVGAPRKFQSQHRHAETFIGVVRILAPQRHQPVVRKSHGIPQRPQMLLDQPRVEAVVARREPACAS